MISHFFIDRPIFAGVISVLVTMVGGVFVFSEPVTAALVAGCVLTVSGILIVDNEK